MIVVRILAARVDVPVCASFWYYLFFFLSCMNLGSHGMGGGAVCVVIWGIIHECARGLILGW